MKMTIGCSQFCDAFKNLRPDNFSIEGLHHLFNHLDDYDEELELDVIAICCDYTEYENLQEALDAYNNIDTLKDLQNETIVIEVSNSTKLIIQNF